MNQMRHSRLRSIMLGAALLVALVATTPSAQVPRLEDLMQLKLQYTQRLLEAVVLEQHAEVERRAGDLKALSEASTWSQLQSDEYFHFADEFQRVAEELIAEAQFGHNDGVAYAFTELILVCSDCHSYARIRPQAGNRSLPSPLPKASDRAR